MAAATFECVLEKKSNICHQWGPGALYREKEQEVKQGS